MIATLISLEDIELAYVEQVDPEQHVLLEQKTEGVYTVIKQGPAIRELLLTMLNIKSDSIEE